MQELFQTLRLSLINIDFATLDSRWNYENVISPFTRMYYILKGKAEVHHNGQSFDLIPDHIYLIPSFTYSNYTCAHYHEQYYISFFEEISNGLSIFNLEPFIYKLKAQKIDRYCFERLLHLNPDRGLLNDDPQVYDNLPYLQRYERLNDRLSTQDYLESQAILKLLLSRFISRNKNSTELSVGATELSYILSYIGENLHKKLSIKHLAIRSNFSTDYFSRMFKDKIGMRPNRYIQMKRVERAQLLLLTTNRSLQQIAENTGLENLSYFSRVFKKFTGKSPGNFRTQRLRV